MLHRPLFPLLCLTAAATSWAEDVPTFAKDIAPIFAERCTSCHGEKKAKAGLRLDSLEAVLKGGKEGKIVTPGKPEHSDLYEAITKKPGEDGAMPPKNGPLKPEQVALIKRWIAAGAK